ncbi:putative disease resistance protein RGA4 [Solanum tuberosum]|uniref:Disease resistance protein RGA4 n=1 Tax=Solanum tuberosum TaxID=4113 RepID=M1AG91_SOLTU|nr:PREDICTED: putative disease resistance protein RGA4 [Solanum tuberosum]
MADAFLQLLLDNLTSFIHGKLVLFFGFEKEFEKLSSMFSTIQAVLEDAQEKQLKDKTIENWLQKLNGAAYEVDDILDECKSEATRFEQSRLGFYHPGIITFRHKIGKRMKEIMEKVDAIAEERRKFHFLEKITERQASTRETGFVLTEPEVYGRDKEQDEIVKILINNVNVAKELPVFPIIGMGGLGKTTLAQMIFNDERVTEHFNPKIWVCVSDDFDEKRLIKTIVGNIERRSLDVEDLASFQKKLQELLTGKRYLLVLDDVWNDDQEKWAKLRAVLKVGARGASVLATTRLEKVGSIMGTLEPYRLSSLSQHDGLLLFMQRAFGQQREINSNLVAVGKEIVKKCGGVPLAAKTLGGILRFKREESEWEHVRDNEIWNLPQDESSILPALRLSYHHLPLNLRQCFAYCAVFPKDTKMEKDNLITLWMAHGFLSSKGNMELEDVGNEVWKELYMRSFFQEVVVDEFGKTYFKMHDLIHDLATSLISANTSSSNIRQVRVGEENNILSIGFSKTVPSYSPSLLKMFVSLRVLDMSYSRVYQLSSSIGNLIHLRLLNLSSTRIRSLPKRLCKLQNLQTLNLKSCRSLSCLPKQTSKLSSLRNLLLDYCPLTSMSPRIGSLTCLKTLDCFVIGKRKGYRLGELRNLNLGGSLSITHLERVKKDIAAKEANLSAKANLYSLCMSWDRSDRYESENDLDEKVLKSLKPHPNLKSLKVTGFRGLRLPDWMNGSVLKNVVSIDIDSCKNCLCLPPFGELPCLESLCLFGGSVDYIEDNVHGCGRFPSLRRLVIKGFPNLKGLLQKEGKDQFPILEEMEIHDCPMLVFPTLACVKKLEVWGNTDATSLSSISDLSILTSLCISHNIEQTSLPEEMFKRLAYLESMSISSFKKLKELPTSLASLTALKRLDIRSCHSLESLPEQVLEGLTSLTELFIQDCEMLKTLSEGLQHLTTLTRLVVALCPEMVTLPFGIQNLHSLQSLVIWSCPRLQSLPAGIMETKNLQALRIVYCPELAKRCEKEIGEDWNKIAHIPNVYIS